MKGMENGPLEAPDISSVEPIPAKDGMVFATTEGERFKVPYAPDGDYLLELERADARRRAAAPAEVVIAEIEAGARYLGQLRELRRGSRS